MQSQKKRLKKTRAQKAQKSPGCREKFILTKSLPLHQYEQNEPAKETGQHIVNHNTKTAVDFFIQQTNRPGFDDIKKAEE